VTLVNAIVQGIFLGAFYAVLACGLSIMFGVMRIINLAHGDIAVFGAYVAFVVVEHTGASAFVAFAVALPLMLALGYILQITVLERSLKAGVLTPLLATFGLSIVIQNLLLITFSPDVRSLGPAAGLLTTASWHATSELSFSALGVVVLAVAIVVFRRGRRRCRARRHRLPLRLCARHRDRGGHRRARWIVPRHPLGVRPHQRPDAAHLRV
jgi:branched-chain amino acid transport system permease protein